MEITFHKHYVSNGLKIYFADQTDQIEIIYTDGRYFIRWKSPEYGTPWKYPSWNGATDGFKTLSDAIKYLESKDWQNADEYYIEDDESAISERYAEIEDALTSIGFTRAAEQFWQDMPVYKMSVDGDEHTIDIVVLVFEDALSLQLYVDGLRLPESKVPKVSNDIGKLLKTVDRFLAKYDMSIFAFTELDATQSKAIMAASTRELAQKLMRVKSSNVWAYYLNVKNYGDDKGDLLVQFKARNGGPGDIYIYYDVPIRVFHRWQSAPSKGHYFWQYIRNVYQYHKLTGNKRGVLPNAIN